MKSYKVGYVCNDGTHRNFTIKSNHVIVHSNRINLMTNPLLGEVLEKLVKKQKNPNSQLNKHGGLAYLSYIRNEDTGTAQTYHL